MSNPGNANKEFAVSYDFDGSKWCASIWASTLEEAEMKLKAMAAGTIDGVITDTIPADDTCPMCGRDYEARS